MCSDTFSMGKVPVDLHKWTSFVTLGLWLGREEEGKNLGQALVIKCFATNLKLLLLFFFSI